tara:strand:- start:122 stop:484 length:363 start_codon:yes stop_codon:yes gene_type:complete
MTDIIKKEDIKFHEVSMVKAVLELVPGAKIAINGNDLSTLVWDETNTGTRPSDSAIQAKYDELVTLWTTTNEPRTDRALSYPNIEEQLDKLFHDIDDGKLDKTGTFYTALKAVKDANPKG